MIYEFAATQSYNGYDKPWPGGDGPNIFDKDTIKTSAGNYILNDSGDQVADSNSSYFTEYTPVEPATTYYKFNGSINAGLQRIYFFDADHTFISRSSVLPNAGGTFTTPEDCAFINYQYIKASVNTELWSINYPATETSFYPYANVCMPEGFNIWDPTNQEFIQVYAGYVNANTRELYLRPVYREYAGEELVGPWMSSLDPYEEDTTPTEGAFVIDFGGELESFEITPFMLQTLLDSLGIRQHFTDGAGLLNKLMDQAQGRVRSEEELLHLSRPLNVIAIGDQLPAGLTFKPISKDVLPGLPGKFIR